MATLAQLFENNRVWAARMCRTNPGLFERLAREQSPEYLWIGCADSRVPADEIVDLPPGELFVHRNVANLVIHTDMNCQSVLQYAVDFLKVKHIIVCGHYGCGGVRAAYEASPHGLVDHWLRHVWDLYQRYKTELSQIPDTASRVDRLCELNVVQQAINVAHSPAVQQAWNRGQSLTIHSWIYRLSTGLLHDLDFCLSGPESVAVTPSTSRVSTFLEPT